MSVGRVLLIVFGAILGLIGLALLAGGGALLYADQALRDGSGYFTSAHERFRTPTRAIVSEGLDLGGVPGGPGRWADLRVRVTGAGGRPVFVGVGPKADVQRYLAGVGQAELTKLDFDPFHATYRDRPGTRVPAPPGDQSFWAAKVQGSGTQTLTWKVESGNWQIVAMNPDGSAGVDATASVGVKVSYVLAVAIGLLVVGLLLLGGGITMIVFGARSPRGPPPPAVAAAGAPGAPAPPEPGGGPGTAVEAAALPPRASTYPVDLTGTLDPGLTRWQWLLKWLLAIPHYVILFFLWIAYFVVSVIAFFAILFTGRYPRGLFEFNSGVLRWSWRVGFYSYSALGTDRYPPFALGPADYPADTRGALPGAPLPGPRAGQVVAAGHPAVHHRRHLHRQLGLRLGLGRPVVRLGLDAHRRRPDRDPGALRRRRPALHRPLPAGPLRPRHRPQPLGLPRGRLREPHARRVPAVPPGALIRGQPRARRNPSARSRSARGSRAASRNAPV